MRSRLTAIAQAFKSPLASRTAAATGFQLLRMALQMAFLILLARSLDPDQYGLFAGSAGLATMAGGLSGLGTGMLLVKQVATDRSIWGAAWTHALRRFLVTGALLSVAYVTSVHSLLQITLPTSSFICLALSELLCLPLVYLGGFAFQAFDRIAWSSALPSVMSASRLVGVVAFMLVDQTHELPRYLLYHLGASVAAAGLALVIVHLRLHPRRSHRRVPAGTTREALRFCAGWFTNNALVEMDKSLAVRFGMPATAAAYALAYRLAALLSTPTTSLVLSAQPRLFAARPADRRRISRAVVLAAAGCSAAACVAMGILSPILPWVFGSDYEQARHFALFLTPLPMLFGLRFVLCNLLVAEGHPGERAMVEVLGSVIMIVTAAIFIPRYGSAGIVGMITAAEGATALAAGFALARARRHPLKPFDDLSSPQA